MVVYLTFRSTVAARQQLCWSLWFGYDSQESALYLDISPSKIVYGNEVYRTCAQLHVGAKSRVKGVFRCRSADIIRSDVSSM
jgi:hypothetical protein